MHSRQLGTGVNLIWPVIFVICNFLILTACETNPSPDLSSSFFPSLKSVKSEEHRNQCKSSYKKYVDCLEKIDTSPNRNIGAIIDELSFVCVEKWTKDVIPLIESKGAVIEENKKLLKEIEKNPQFLGKTTELMEMQKTVTNDATMFEEMKGKLDNIVLSAEICARKAAWVEQMNQGKELITCIIHASKADIEDGFCNTL